MWSSSYTITLMPSILCGNAGTDVSKYFTRFGKTNVHRENEKLKASDKKYQRSVHCWGDQYNSLMLFNLIITTRNIIALLWSACTYLFIFVDIVAKTHNDITIFDHSWVNSALVREFIQKWLSKTAYHQAHTAPIVRMYLLKYLFTVLVILLQYWQLIFY